jgi:hypothetical protein
MTRPRLSCEKNDPKTVVTFAIVWKNDTRVTTPMVCNDLLLPSSYCGLGPSSFYKMGASAISTHDQSSNSRPKSIKRNFLASLG